MADFQQHLTELHTAGARIVALSADTEPEARDTVTQLDLQFEVAYGLDAAAASRLIGSYTGERQGRTHLQPAAFLLGRDGTVAHAVYSSGKVGRLTASDAVTILADVAKREQAKP